MKKKDKNFVENYRPVPVLPTVSKMSEGIMQKQINSYIGKFLSLFLFSTKKDSIHSMLRYHWQKGGNYA